MLARIQTLHLFLVALLACGSMLFPFWGFSAPEYFPIGDFTPFEGAGILFTAGTFTSGILSPLTAIASLAAIFLYKQRALQQKVIALGVILFVGDLLSALTAAHFMNQYFLAGGASFIHGPETGFFMILPEPVLLWLAMKGVQKDEKIANAYKRL
jgi:hypothetical protein